MNKTRTIYFGVALTLCAILAFLVSKTESINFDYFNEISATLRSLKQVDSEWNVNVLRSKTGLSSNYDDVARPVPLISSLEDSAQKNIDESVLHGYQNDGQLSAMLIRYKDTMSQKISAIEQFKSHNAILRNSSRFLPVAATEFTNLVRASNANILAKTQVEESLNDLLSTTMTYTLTPDQELRESIVSKMADLRRLVETMPDDLRGQADTLISHVETILKQQEIGDKLLAEIAAYPIAKLIDALSDVNSKWYERRIEEQQQYRKILVVFSIFLLALLGYAGWNMYKSYRHLNRSNDELQKENEESKVQLRQAEKMSALGQMVAGIAHEINTPLAYVKGTFDVIKEQLSPVDDLTRHAHEFSQLMRAPVKDHQALTNRFTRVETISNDMMKNCMVDELRSILKDGIHGIEQISEIILNLKNFSRLDRAKVSEFSVCEGLASTLLITRHQ